MAGVLAALFGVLAGVVSLVAALNFWSWFRDRAQSAFFWLGLLAVVQVGVLISGAVVVERPSGAPYADALFVRSALLGVSGTVVVIALSRLVPGLRVTGIATFLAVVAVGRTVLWSTTDLLVHHPVSSHEWPTYGPVIFTGLLYGLGTLYVSVRAIRLSDRTVRRILGCTAVGTVVVGAVTGAAHKGFLSDVSITLAVVPASVGILCLGALTVTRTAQARDVLLRRQRTLAELGRLALPATGGEWVRSRAEALLAKEFDAAGSTLQISPFGNPAQPPAGNGEVDGATVESIQMTGRSCIVTAWITRPLDPPARRYAESLVQLVAAAADRSSAEAELAHGTTHDQLTGLPNRLLLVDRIDGLLADREAGPTVLALCRLNGVDGVAAVESHAAADAVTVAVADALAVLVAGHGFLARDSTDVFALVVQLLPAEEVSTALGIRLEMLTAALGVTLHGPAVRVSIGVVVSDVAVVSNGAGTAEDLLRDAGVALGRAVPGGVPEIFDVELGARARAKAELAEDLDHAVAADEIEVYYQPIVDAHTRRVRSYEALARWRRHGRILPPAEWIPIAEQNGLIDTIGLHVLAIACHDQRQLGTPVAVNVSTLQVMGKDFVGQVVRRLGDCPPDQLVLEVTESVVMPDVAAGVRVLADLRGRGIRIALDDFGTSYSSLSVLATLPVDVLKIDRLFVEALAEESGSPVVTSIVSLARALGKTTVAEGVETEQQFAALVDLGVDTVQGYLVGRPAPLVDLVAPSSVPWRDPYAVA